ncbi:MAG: Holliday junction resolvase RuvX [Anaeroplasmataceae bacterium]|nr:Holliday junction resolvase RuvX [Anaeroplasmataceae bacterium]
MKYIGLDLGSKTLGIAISDELGFLARALETFRFEEDNYSLAVNYISALCEKEKVTKVVLGLPKHMNGDQGVRAQISYDFKAELESKGNISVILEDERLTTVLVDRAMISGNMRRTDRKQKKDEMAAVVILQNYLDKLKF